MIHYMSSPSKFACDMECFSSMLYKYIACRVEEKGSLLKALDGEEDRV